MSFFSFFTRGRHRAAAHKTGRAASRDAAPQPKGGALRSRSEPVEMLRDLARHHPDAPACLGPDGAVSLADLDREANRYANYLLSIAPQARRVALVERVSFTGLAAMLGILKAGRCVVPLAKRHGGRELAALAGASGCGAVLCADGVVQRIAGHARVPVFTLEPAAVERDREPGGQENVQAGTACILAVLSGQGGVLELDPGRLVTLCLDLARREPVRDASRVVVSPRAAEQFSPLLALACVLGGLPLIPLPELPAVPPDGQDGGGGDALVLFHADEGSGGILSLASGVGSVMVVGRGATPGDLLAGDLPPGTPLWDLYAPRGVDFPVAWSRAGTPGSAGEGMVLRGGGDVLELRVLDRGGGPAEPGDPGEIALGLSGGPGTDEDGASKTMVRTGDQGRLMHQGGLRVLEGKAGGAAGSVGQRGGGAREGDMEREEHRTVIVEFLAEEGYRPRIDSEGDVMFKSEGVYYYILLPDDDPVYYRLLRPGFWPIESEEELSDAQVAATRATAGIKVAKVGIAGDEVFAVTETFCSDPHHYVEVLPRMLSAVRSVVREFVEEMRSLRDPGGED